MKQVTIENVRERIARIEECASRMPGGLRLSMNTEFELACLRALLGMMQSVQVLPSGWRMVPTEPQAAQERDQMRAEHAEWSQSTFGNVGPIGPLKHLSIEALEAAEAPGDLSEWADLQFLMWDAQRRAGITDEQITQAMIDKLAVNKARTWPEPKDGEPRLHIQAENDNTAQQFEALAGRQAEDDNICYGERCNVCDEMIIGRSPDGMCVSCRDELSPNTEPCVICGVVSSHPEGWHYCHSTSARSGKP